MSVVTPLSGDANAGFIDTWNEILVPKFRRFRHVFVSTGNAHSDPAIDTFGFAPGQSVLDIGCGFGETTLRIAQRIAPGIAVGFDCAEGFLEAGRADAARAGVSNVRFELGDAQTHAMQPVYDVLFARFGTMFFSSPMAAMKNLRRALKPGGRFLALVWRRIEDNEWMALPKRVALEHLPPPGDNARTCGPGPFSWADTETVQAILEGAGFGDVGFERRDVLTCVGRTPDDAIEFQLALGPAGEIVREAAEEGEAKRPKIVEELRRALEPYARPDGVFMSTSTWAVTARNPGG